MNVDLGDADAAVAVAISVLDDYIGELARVGRLRQQFTLQRQLGSILLDVLIEIDVPRFEMVNPLGGDPYTRLVITGTIEARPAGDPGGDPLATFDLDAKVKLGLVLVADAVAPGSTEPPSPNPVVGLEYQGVDGTPADPVTAADLDEVFADPALAELLAGTRIDLAGPLVAGLNHILFPDPDTPDPATWDVRLALMAGTGETDDAFACLVARPGSVAIPTLSESFVVAQTGLAVSYGRGFLDEVLGAGAAATVASPDTINGAKITTLELKMGDESMLVDGAGVRPVWWVMPDVDFTFKGPIDVKLVRGTTAMNFDVAGVKVHVDESDEIFYAVAKWFSTVVAGALLFTGVGWLAGVGIALWFTAVQEFWGADVEIGNAPNTLRESLAAALGVQLAQLSESLDDDTEVKGIRIDATPDSLVIAQGNMVFLAQVLVVAIEGRMRSAEYSKRLRRFAIFELVDGRRFRAQELARLMAAEKVTVRGFHQVDGNYVRANPDDVEANNLLRRYKSNLTTEPVVKTIR
ncbi:MAG: hypothetical protein ABIP03_13800 [Aquihabitans sp.]